VRVINHVILLDRRNLPIEEQSTRPIQKNMGVLFSAQIVLI
jgi:hypothetical protein